MAFGGANIFQVRKQYMLLDDDKEKSWEGKGWQKKRKRREQMNS